MFIKDLSVVCTKTLLLAVVEAAELLELGVLRQ